MCIPDDGRKAETRSGVVYLHKSCANGTKSKWKYFTNNCSLSISCFGAIWYELLVASLNKPQINKLTYSPFVWRIVGL
jgi:hypothetical protein